jgi:hypothetical protein
MTDQEFKEAVRKTLNGLTLIGPNEQFHSMIVNTARATLIEVQYLLDKDKLHIPVAQPDVLPHWVHDCLHCRFLETFKNHGGIYDLYYSNRCNSGFPTIIARYGNQGGDYLSGMSFGRQEYRMGRTNRPLARAYELVLNHGLDTGMR